MVFSSLIFLFVFFPVILIGYYGIFQQQHRNIFLLGSSLFFYSWGEPTYIVLILLSVCINFRVGLMVDREGNPRIRKQFLSFGVFGNLFFLFLFKYEVFFTTYFTIAHQINHRKTTYDQFTEGVKRFIIGMSKKIIFANQFSIIAIDSFGKETPSVAFAWLGAICYTLQIYYDFSGYSDMAIGLGKMFGFDFLRNVNNDGILLAAAILMATPLFSKLLETIYRKGMKNRSSLDDRCHFLGSLQRQALSPWGALSRWDSVWGLGR